MTRQSTNASDRHGGHAAAGVGARSITRLPHDRDGRSPSLQWHMAGGHAVVWPRHLHGRGRSGSPPDWQRALADVVGDRRIVIVTTPTPWRLHGRAWLRDFVGATTASPVADVLVGPWRERDKVLATVERIWQVAERHRLGRDDLLVAFGGGVACDLVTMAASGYRRGIGYVAVPTTLVAQVDAGIGLKGGVNLDGSKNRIGTFWGPRLTSFDPAWLQTLPAEAVRDGLAEIAKVGIMRDRRLFELVEHHGPRLVVTAMQDPPAVRDEIMHRAVMGMLDELAHDPFETGGYRRRMDFGHTWSPLVESRSGYAISHGTAVAIDMRVSCWMANRLGLLAADEAARVTATLDAIGLPQHRGHWSADTVLDALDSCERHRGGRVHLPLPVEIGLATFVDDKHDVVAAVRPAIERLDHIGSMS